MEPLAPHTTVRGIRNLIAGRPNRRVRTSGSRGRRCGGHGFHDDMRAFTGARATPYRAVTRGEVGIAWLS